MKSLTLRRGRQRDRGRDGDSQQEQRLETVSVAVEQFTFDLGLLMAGRETAFEASATVELAGRLRVALDPFLRSGELLRPDFGAFGELRIEGDLISPDAQMRAALEFEDRSMRESPDGRLIGSIRRRVRMDMSLSMEPCRVVDCHFSLMS